MNTPNKRSDQAIAREGAILVYEYSKKTPLVYSILACLTILLLPPSAYSTQFWIWCAVAVAVIATRTVISRAYEQGQYDSYSGERLIRRLRIMVVISGLLWGALPGVIGWSADNSYESFVPVFLAAIAAGGIGVFSSVLWLARTFVLCICVPFIIHCLLSSAVTALFGVSVVAYGAYLVYVCKTMNQMTTRTLTLTHDKEVLIADLEKARKEAEAASQAKSDFLAKMSHEIRTPLNGILGVAGIIKETVNDNETYEHIRTIHESGRVLLSLVNDILDISKIEAGKLQLHLSSFSIAEEVNRVRTLLEPLAHEHRLTLTFSVDPRCQHVYLGDVLKLGQVLTNLVGNGIKFTPPGGRVSLTVRPGEGDRVEFVVKDSGVGIPQEDIGRIFQAFEQSDKVFGHHAGGTGLGLTICSHLVSLMGGVLCVDSTVKKGSTFSFSISLPRSKKKEIPDEVYSPEVTFAPGLSVLVAEDNGVNQLVARKVLERTGCKVTTVENGREALRVLDTHAFDVILLDCRMPILDGYDTARAIRKWGKIRNSYIPVIAVTAQAMEEDKALCYAAGMDGYVTKPFDKHALVAEIKRVLNRI